MGISVTQHCMRGLEYGNFRSSKFHSVLPFLSGQLSACAHAHTVVCPFIPVAMLDYGMLEAEIMVIYKPIISSFKSCYMIKVFASSLLSTTQARLSGGHCGARMRICRNYR